MKKLFLFIFIFSFGFFSINQNITYSDEDDEGDRPSREEYMADCAEGQDCLDQPTFQIGVGTITPGITAEGQNIEERTNWLLGTFIQRMMIALGVLSVFIMTIGAGYIILNNGQDELLSKGKTIFMSGIYSVLIALASYYLISIIRYMLFT